MGGFNKFLASDHNARYQGISTHALWEEMDKDFKQWGTSTRIPFTMQAPSAYGTLPVTNGLQAFLDAIVRCSPQPRLSPILLLHLAKMYGCGTQATILLQAGLSEAKIPKEQSAYRHCLRQLYVRLVIGCSYSCIWCFQRGLSSSIGITNEWLTND